MESLSLEEKKEYIKKGRSAQEKLISHNLPLVMTIAGEKYKSLEYLDRVQAGNMGLLKAIQYFNPHRGNKFATYASYLIDSEISNYARSLRKQRVASPAETCFVPTDEEIERVARLMGGVYWMRAITADTDQTPDRIRKQIAVLLQEKKRMESVANDSIHGPRELTDDEYDDVLKEAVQSRTGRVQRKKHKTGENNSPSSDRKKRNKKLDLLTGDGLPPREDEMSTEDYIRSFFAAVVSIRDISPKTLSNYILGERRFLQHKAEALRKFLDDPWAYTDEMAISELETLIQRDNIWPERCLIERTKEWGWLESKYSDMEVGMTRCITDKTKFYEFGRSVAEFPPASEKMNIEEMILGYTINGAIQLGIEDKKGSIAVGKDADYLVFDKDLLTAEHEGFSYNKPREVYFAGKKVN
ncbi:MAG: amidohydrolase family protein [Clostridia bacterium]|nr:amidohydrolase family protein [Clostridia bacterium]